MRTAIYVRVAISTPTGQLYTERKSPIEQQLDLIRQRMVVRPAMPAAEDIFRDEGYGGHTLDRPALNHLRALVSLGIYERVLVTSPDRLSRDHRQMRALIEEFEHKGCQIEFSD